MAYLSKVKLPDNTVVDIKDASALHVTGTAAEGNVPTYDATSGTVIWGTSADTKVTQTASTTDGALPVLIAKGAVDTTDSAVFDADVTINPGSGEINCVSYTVGGATEGASTVVATKTATGGWLWS